MPWGKSLKKLVSFGQPPTLSADQKNYSDYLRHQYGADVAQRYEALVLHPKYASRNGGGKSIEIREEK